MVRTTLSLFVLLGVVLCEAQADEKPEAAKAQLAVPPRLVTVGRIDQQNGKIDLRDLTVRFIWDPNRKAIYEDHGWTLSLESAEVFDVENKKLTNDELWKRVAVGAVVAISADAKKVDRAFLKALAKDTIVFVSPEYAVNSVLQSARQPVLFPQGTAQVPATP